MAALQRRQEALQRRQEETMQQLREAIAVQDTERVRKLLHANTDFDASADNNILIREAAVHAGNDEEIISLLLTDARVNPFDDTKLEHDSLAKFDAVSEAIIHGEFAWLLIQNRQYSPTPDENVIALAMKHESYLDDFLGDDRFDPNSTVDGATALTWAIRNGSWVDLQELLRDERILPDFGMILEALDSNSRNAIETLEVLLEELPKKMDITEEVNEALAYAVDKQNPEELKKLLTYEFADVNVKLEPDDKVLIQIAFDKYKKAYHAKKLEKTAFTIMALVFMHRSFVAVPDEELTPIQAAGEAVVGERRENLRWLVKLQMYTAGYFESMRLIKKLPPLHPWELCELVSSSLTFSNKEAYLKEVFSIPGAHTVLRDLNRSPNQPKYENVCWLLRQRFTKNWGIRDLRQLAKWSDESNEKCLERVLRDERLMVGKDPNTPLAVYFSDNEQERARVQLLYAWEVGDRRARIELWTHCNSLERIVDLESVADFTGITWTSDLRAAIQFNHHRIFEFLLDDNHYEAEVPIELYYMACAQGRVKILATMVKHDKFASVDGLVADAADDYAITRRLLRNCYFSGDAANDALVAIMLTIEGFKNNVRAIYETAVQQGEVLVDLPYFTAADGMPQFQFANRDILDSVEEGCAKERVFAMLEKLNGDGKLGSKQVSTSSSSSSTTSAGAGAGAGTGAGAVIQPIPTSSSSSSGTKRRREGETEEDALQIDGSVRLLISQL